jgi:hypothetical protein
MLATSRAWRRVRSKAPQVHGDSHPGCPTSKDFAVCSALNTSTVIFLSIDNRAFRKPNETKNDQLQFAAAYTSVPFLSTYIVTSRYSLILFGFLKLYLATSIACVFAARIVSCSVMFAKWARSSISSHMVHMSEAIV